MAKNKKRDFADSFQGVVRRLQKESAKEEERKKKAVQKADGEDESRYGKK